MTSIELDWIRMDVAEPWSSWGTSCCSPSWGSCPGGTPRTPSPDHIGKHEMVLETMKWRHSVVLGELLAPCRLYHFIAFNIHTPSNQHNSLSQFFLRVSWSDRPWWGDRLAEFCPTFGSRTPLQQGSVLISGCSLCYIFQIYWEINW